MQVMFFCKQVLALNKIKKTLYILKCMYKKTDFKKNFKVCIQLIFKLNLFLNNRKITELFESKINNY